MTVKAWDGEHELDADLFTWNGASELASTAVPMPPGYTSVAAMLATPGFKVAHRGGSRDWPEMSARGYTESVARGAGALEVSLARTSDGVWFGAHDQYLDRVALGTGGSTLNPASMTWAQVSALSIRGDTAEGAPSQPAQPFMRFEDLCEAYGRSHVFFVDPKHAEARRAEFFALLAACLPPERTVVKYWGVNGGLGRDAQTRGYQTWGYFYQAQFDDGTFAAQQDAWTMLGIENYALDATWAIANGTGKPIIGHIAATTAAANNALSKGADGVMVSGVRAVIKNEGI